MLAQGGAGLYNGIRTGVNNLCTLNVAFAQGRRTELYTLRALEDGSYPVMQWGSKQPVDSVFMKAGDIWKYGITKNPSTRYTQNSSEKTI